MLGPKFEKKLLIELAKKYNSDGKIGALFGMSRQAIRYWRLKWGIPAMRLSNPEKHRRKFLERGTQK